MGAETIRARPLGIAAAGLVALEALLAVLGERSPILAGLVLLLAPGLALQPLLPAALRRAPLAALAAAPALGFAASSVALVSLARAGVHLGPVSVRLTIAGLVAIGLALRAPAVTRAPLRPLELLGLAAALLAGVVLQRRVIGGSPVPGNDWAKYVLYADEIHRHGTLLIRNPYWMLGAPFREDPGVPALYGAFLYMTKLPAGVLVHGIWVFALSGILAVFAYARALWGPLAGVAAAALYAVIPIDQDILGWHGLANVAALSLLPLLLLYAGELWEGRMPWREAAGLGLTLAGLAAAHRLSLLVGLAALGLVALAVLATRGVAVGLRALAPGAVATLALVGLVAWDLLSRESSFGGTQSYRAYLSTKVDLSLLGSDLSWPFVVLALAALALAAREWRRAPAVRAPLALLAVAALLAYSWIAHVPMSYLRLAYYLPVALCALGGFALARVGRPRLAAAALVGLCAWIFAIAWSQATNVRRLYGFANPASLRGLDALGAQLRPGEVVVTDRCWSFLGTWLLHTRTLPALAPADIEPKAELPYAQAAQAVLSQTPTGQAIARRLGVRYAIVDPTCTDPAGRQLEPPFAARPVYLSERLAILRLAG